MAKNKKDQLWVVTANDLLTGDVVYLDSKQHWTRDLQQADILACQNIAATRLESATVQSDIVVGAELIAVIASKNTVVPETLRERLRNRGPSVVYQMTAN